MLIQGENILLNSEFLSDGYFDGKACQKKYNENFKNVISCSDNLVFNFINWIKKQPFYENTTVVLISDHLTMNEKIFKKKKYSPE